MTHEQIADRFGCSERLVRDVKENREKYETEAAAGSGGNKKNRRTGDFPEVRYTAVKKKKNLRLLFPQVGSRAFFLPSFFFRVLFVLF